MLVPRLGLLDFDIRFRRTGILDRQARAGSSRAGTRCCQRLNVAAYATACSAL
jgi:hypothetical protein